MANSGLELGVSLLGNLLQANTNDELQRALAVARLRVRLWHRRTLRVAAIARDQAARRRRADDEVARLKMQAVEMRGTVEKLEFERLRLEAALAAAVGARRIAGDPSGS